MPNRLTRLLRRLLLWLLERLPEDGSLLAQEAQPVLPVEAAVLPTAVIEPSPALIATMAVPAASAARFRVIAYDSAGHTQTLYAGLLGAKAREAYELAHSANAVPITIELWDADACRGKRTTS